MKAKNKNAGGFSGWVQPEVKGCIAGGAAVLTVTVLAALLVSVAGLPLSLAPALSTAALVVGGLLGGFVTALKLKKNGLFCGMLCGFLLFLGITTVSLIAFHSAPGSATLTRFIVLVAAGGLGGIFGVAKAGKRKVV